MRSVRLLISLLVLALAAGPARAVDEADEWRMFGNVLALVQHFVRLAAQSPDPQAMQKGIDALFSGENPEANRVAGEILDEMLREMPAEHRGTFLSVARDFMTIARRENARAAERADPVFLEREREGAMQARKDLHAMGLRYWDTAQFLDAVKRDDALAVELYVLARGVNLSARDADGRSAVEIARAAGNRKIVELLARNLP